MIRGARKALSIKKENLTHCKMSTSTLGKDTVSRKSCVKYKFLGEVTFACYHLPLDSLTNV